MIKEAYIAVLIVCNLKQLAQQEIMGYFFLFHDLVTALNRD